MPRTCTVADAEAFERTALPSHTLIYFTADHARRYDGLDLALHERSNPTMRRVVNIVRRLANDGYVDLVQRRNGNLTEYRAIWREYRLPKDARPLPLPLEIV